MEEIVDSQRPGCPIEYFNIPVSRSHSQFNPQGKDNLEMTFKRSRYDQRTGYSPNNPRQQVCQLSTININTNHIQRGIRGDFKLSFLFLLNKFL